VIGRRSPSARGAGMSAAERRVFAGAIDKPAGKLTRAERLLLVRFENAPRQVRRWSR
jgi:hypothetical protein